MNRKEKIKVLRRTVFSYYRRHGRCLPWRETVDPYKILVSEIMLQQTQVDRVIPFYKTFIKQFPHFASLAKSSDKKILLAWQGLGYNRRALYLKRIAHIVLKDYYGRLPSEETDLKKFPGIGTGTIGSLRAFAFNLPSVFIETNIRRVFIHFFFPKKENVSDEVLLPLIAKALDERDPRRWYSALMDYGTYLALTEEENPNMRYVRAPKFEGSRRQLRGQILKKLLQKPKMTNPELARALQKTLSEIRVVRAELKREGFAV